MGTSVAVGERFSTGGSVLRSLTFKYEYCLISVGGWDKCFINLCHQSVSLADAFAWEYGQPKGQGFQAVNSENSEW